MDEAANSPKLPPLLLSGETLREVEDFSRRSRIALLRHEAEQSAVRACGFVQLGAGGLLAASILLMVPILIAGGPLAGVALILTGVVGAISCMLAITALLSIRSDYVTSLHLARRQLSEATLFSQLLDSAQWEQLRERLSRRLPALLRHKAAPRDFSGHLAYAACHLKSLAELSAGGTIPASRAAKGELIHLLQPLFSVSSPIAVVATLAALLLLGLLWPLLSGVALLGAVLGTLISLIYLLLAIAVFLGREYIASRAALAVICDMLLGNGMDDESRS